ncbi:hypothetical protein [Streptomyces sp. GQFP]|uniref:hypothetical protein n=1 Tax=Streptomyces sp. GQFP TaxID=2907545 RepID=UPI001F38CBBE|nr:hypothetical protein [Streptomyces sp. GQFP]UIX32757.1 hypothetical protein LUX31_23520 [Streptomyces sp. GQFP]
MGEAEEGHAGQVRVVVVQGGRVGRVRAARVQEQGARVLDDPDLGLGPAEHDQQGQGEQYRADGGRAQRPARPGARGTGRQDRRRAVAEGRADAPHAVRGQGCDQRQAEGEGGAGQEVDDVPADRGAARVFPAAGAAGTGAVAVVVAGAVAVVVLGMGGLLPAPADG